jgi:hypothetical protein
VLSGTTWRLSISKEYEDVAKGIDQLLNKKGNQRLVSKILCDVLRKFFKEQEQAELIAQNGGFSNPNDAFMKQAEQDAGITNHFDYLPKMHEPLSLEHLKDLTDEEALILYETQSRNAALTKDFFKICNMWEQKSRKYLPQVRRTKEERENEIHSASLHQRILQARRMKQEEEERQDKSKSMFLGSDISETSDQKIKS